MKRFFLLTFAALSALFFVSCSESTSPSTNNLTFVSGINQSTLTNSGINIKGDEIQNDLTSIKIESIRILLNNISVKLNDSERNIKLTPVVFTITDSNKSFEFANADIPSGAMDKIKIEIHRFASSEIASYQNNAIFKDFATNERYTILIKGNLVSGTTETPFEYKTDIVGNLSFDFKPPINIQENVNQTIEFQFQSDMVFKSNGELLDPRDSKNKSHIDNQIKNAIKGIKK